MPFYFITLYAVTLYFSYSFHFFVLLYIFFILFYLLQFIVHISYFIFRLFISYYLILYNLDLLFHILSYFISSHLILFHYILKFLSGLLPSKRNVSTSSRISRSVSPVPSSSLTFSRMSRKSNFFIEVGSKGSLEAAWKTIFILQVIPHNLKYLTLPNLGLLFEVEN